MKSCGDINQRKSHGVLSMNAEGGRWALPPGSSQGLKQQENSLMHGKIRLCSPRAFLGIFVLFFYFLKAFNSAYILKVLCSGRICF